MSGVKHLEDDLRRSMRAAAGSLVVDDREFDPDVGVVVDLHDLPDIHRRSRRVGWTTLIAAAAVVVIIGTALIARPSNSSNPGKVGESAPTTYAVTTTSFLGDVRSAPAPSALVAKVTSVPAEVLRTVGRGTSLRTPTALPGPTLTDGSKPRIVWVGAEYCPYCAGERWPLIAALSRFGEFSGLRTTSSSLTTSQGSPEVFPNTQTFSFYGSTYSSPYVTFDPFETLNNHFATLQALPPDIAQLQRTYDAPPYVDPGSQGAIPFVDFANRYLASGASFDISVLQSKTADEIASALSDPATGTAKAVDGAANTITAAICRLTNDQPAAVCTDPTIAAIEHQLGA